VVTEAVSQAAVAMANQLNAAAIFTLTSTGFTSRLTSKHRPACPILAITASSSVARWLCMNWGVLPILYPGERSDLEKIQFGLERAMHLGYVRHGDIIVATAGHREKAGGTDLIRVSDVAGDRRARSYSPPLSSSSAAGGRASQGRGLNGPMYSRRHQLPVAARSSGVVNW
jgi:pyruvate kinase